MYACKGCPWSTRGCRRAERRTLPVHGWERCPLAADVAGTAGKSETKTKNAEAWKRAFLATEALLGERERNGRILAEARGKRDAEALEDAE